MDEKFVEFLRYGLSQTIKKKDIFIINCIMMFFSLFLTLADGYPSLKWGIVSITPVAACIILLSSTLGAPDLSYIRQIK